MKKVLFALVATIPLVTAVLISSFWNYPAPEKKPVPANAQVDSAVFAGGCFWCVEANFEKVDGVIEVISGYTGGHTVDPTYREVCSHTTGHLEAVKVNYDSRQITYSDLLEVFWRTIDPTDADGQFVDRGQSYTSAIFVANESQRQLAEKSKQNLADSKRFSADIVTPIRDAREFYPAEDYHQDYYLTHPLKYKVYRYGSGRDQFIAKHWGKEAKYQVINRRAPSQSNSRHAWSDQPADDYVKPSDASLKQRLTRLQYNVTQHDSTERPFKNKYWNEKRAGIYVDIVSGEPLFSSRDKFDSGTGWPSFSRPLVSKNIQQRVDRSLFATRTEVRSRHADSHLGHVFEDGPEPTGLRYCINSASLQFVPVDMLESQGYGFFKQLFESEEPA